MIVTSEQAVNHFIYLQARILAVAEGHREEDFDPLLRFFLEDRSCLFDYSVGIMGLAKKDLEAGLAEENFFPEEHMGSHLLGAYETAQAYSRVALAGITLKRVYGRSCNPELRKEKQGEIYEGIRAMHMNFTLANAMYDDALHREFDPLRDVRDYAFDQHATAVKELCRDSLREHAGEFPTL